MSQPISQARYQYEPLEPEDRNVRLLTLYPASDDTIPIKCSVANLSLNWNPPYEALSYTWGDPNDRCQVPIDFDGYPAHISTNLEAALRVLRYHDEPRQLWIDALCINQDDVLEKNKQVPLMGNIFAQAQNVIIWLGPQSVDSGLAMSAISNMTSAEDFDNITEPAWDALENLFSRPWFSRIWVLQEFKRAKNPIFQCGKATFRWGETGDAIREFWDKDGEIGPKYVKLLGELGKVVSMASTRVQVPMDVDFDTEYAARDLVRMLRIYGGCKATIPHDKVYGLLGLSDSFSFPTAQPPAICYNHDVKDVYTEWARFLMLSQQSLDLLYVSQRMLHDPSLPSWVPDWRTARHDLLLTLDIFRHSFKHTNAITKEVDRSLIFDQSGRLLVVKGFVVTTLNPGFRFFQIQPDFIASKLASTPRKELLRACLMMGCRLKNLTVEEFATKGLAEGRKQFRGSKGSTGLVPQATQHQDIICSLASAEILFVLRPVGSQYKLVGDGYIDVGEEFNFQQNPQIQEFTIQ